VGGGRGWGGTARTIQAGRAGAIDGLMLKAGQVVDQALRLGGTSRRDGRAIRWGRPAGRAGPRPHGTVFLPAHHRAGKQRKLSSQMIMSDHRQKIERTWH